MTTLLNPDFELNTFHWLYTNCTSSGPTVVTYTAVFYDTTSSLHNAEKEPFMTVSYEPLTDKLVVTEFENTVESRVLDALKRHYSASFMKNEGFIMTAEYAAYSDDPDCRLHHDPKYGQAIFGCDLEEAYDNQ